MEGWWRSDFHCRRGRGARGRVPALRGEDGYDEEAVEAEADSAGAAEGVAAATPSGMPQYRAPDTRCLML